MNKKLKTGLYRQEFEKDSCGIGFIAHLKGKKSHRVIEDALVMLQNMDHRGGCGCEPNTGDGAGILLQVPHQFLFEECEKAGITIPSFGGYGVGMLFLPKDNHTRAKCKELFNKYADKLDLEIIGYRDVPTNNRGLGDGAIKVEPKMEMVFVKFKEGIHDPELLERRIFILRKYATHKIHDKLPTTKDNFYLSSLSYKTIVYKGQLTPHQLKAYYPDLSDKRMVSSLALIHSRFSTNTFPKWKLAQPFDYIAHNGEINTIKGNVNKMKSKEFLLDSKFFTRQEIEMMLPICDPERSDSGNLDSIIEFLHFGGRSLPQSMMMLIPEAWQEDKLMDKNKRDFYEYYASMMEPWDGPASICFTDGKIVGATLDRNGLRPSRYTVTKTGYVIMASEAGVLPVEPSKVLKKGRLQPGRMFVVDLEQGRIVSDEELKKSICAQQPYGKWLQENRLKLSDLPQPEKTASSDVIPLTTRQKAFGYTSEDLKVILAPMCEKATEPVGSMGADIPLAVFSQQSQHLSNYFKQLFAQVSNPPIDSIRERSVMSLYIRIGNFLNIFSETPAHCKQIHHDQPVLLNAEIQKLKEIEFPGFKSVTIDALFEPAGKKGALEKGLNRMCREARKAVHNGCNILILSDKKMNSRQAAIPSLLALGAVHHHLIGHGLRSRVGLVIEAGDVRETHHFATLAGYGANAVNPYLAFDSILAMKKGGAIQSDADINQLFDNYIKAINYGLLKVMSKMGISTLQSYFGSQIFEAIGIGDKVIEKCFKGTVSRIGGLDFEGIAKEALIRHKAAFAESAVENKSLEVGGIYQWKRKGEAHLFNPETIHLLQYSAQRNDYNLYKKFAEKINDQSEKIFTLRSLLRFKKRKSIPLSQVEPKENIFKRFATGAMSFGSISHEAHSTLAIAMNRIGGKSNSGEGGEDEIRFEKKINGDWENSAIKQVASGRFGVTSYYLTNAKELQIKMAQGAKPGEGGQLPGHKVDEWIARVRHSTPGVGLISPPPHHDIYSIEDLAQLIFDLKNANRKARINVKLVAETGVGTIAAGVAKAKADVILISGHDGGTGASPWSSIRHAGLPWELGLAEAQQTLVRNNLRSRVVLQTDGQLRTGRDLAIAALLGAEEWGISTAALVVEGCILMRKCHLNTCPVGIATQNPELRKRFTGNPDHVINYFTFLAEDLREIMAELGFKTVDEMVGQADVLRVKENTGHWKVKELNLKPLIYKEPAADDVGIYHQTDQDHEIENVLDWQLLKSAREKLDEGKNFYKEFEIKNTDRAVGALLSNEISKKYKGYGLPKGTLHFKFRGSAGQSFGAFAAPGVRFELEGEANDYFGKGLSGAQLIVYPDQEAAFKPEENIIIGNVAFYGATSGEAYIRGMAGERFCVRNSGVTAVVEGVGDHGCEYMTGGAVVVLGETGKNFAAGMSGGIAYVYDPSAVFHSRCNMEMVAIESLDEEDIATLERLLRNHLTYTKSNVAKDILSQLPRSLNFFQKVMPRDYKAALVRMKSAEIKKSIAV